MVKISNVEIGINVGDFNDPPKAQLNFDLKFSPDELDLNLEYTIRAWLYEQDQGRDDYIVITNGPDNIRAFLGYPATGDEKRKDDFIANFTGISSLKTRPDGEETVSFNLEAELSQQRLEKGASGPVDGPGKKESYYPVVYVTNDLAPAQEQGSNVNIDLV